MSGFDPLDSVRTGVASIQAGTTVAAPPPPAALPRRDSAPAEERRDDAPADSEAEPDTDAASLDVEGGGDSGSAVVDITAPTRTGTTRTRRRTPASRAADPEPEADDLPGFERGARRQIGVGLTEGTFEALRAARGGGRSNGDVVLDALRATHGALVAEFAPDPTDEGDGLFPAQPRRKRRLDVEGIRRMEFMCSPAEAKVIGDLARQCDLSLSALIEEGLTRHLNVAQSELGGSGPG